MPSRPCLDCGRLVTGPRTPHRGVRCPPCAQGHATRRQVTAAETRRRAETVAAHREQYGDLCPGYRRAPHPSVDLTADHIVPVAAGGAEDGELGVLCRECNSSKAANVATP